MDKYIHDFYRSDFPDCSFSLDFSKAPVEDVIVNGKSVVANRIARIKNGNSGIDTSVYKYCDFLYGIRYNDLDYDYAKDYFDDYKPNVYGTLGIKPFACSSIRVKNYYGRNFDFYYNYDCTFVIRTSRKGDRNATLGIGSFFNKLTSKFVESGQYDDAYKVLPFMIVDGINEHGVFVNINVVTVEGQETTGTVPTCEKKGELCMMMMPRFILDNYSTAREAILDIQAHYSVYAYKASAISGSELHFMIGDENETYMVEFVNNKLVYEKLGEVHPEIMTNFYTIGTKLINGKIDEEPENRSGVALLGCGIERYNKLVDRMDYINGKENMVEAMRDIWYTKSYNPENKMYTEFVGLPDHEEKGKVLTVETPREHYSETLLNAQEAYKNRHRVEKGTDTIWHTTHCSVYDIKERKLYLHLQEDIVEAKEFEFDFNKKIVLE